MEKSRNEIAIKGMEKFELTSTKIGGDIYGIAFCALVDANKIKDGIIFSKDKGKILPHIDYNEKETSSIFGAIRMEIKKMSF